MNPKKRASILFYAGAFLSAFLIYFLIMLSSGYLVPGSNSFYETTYYQEILPYIQAFLRVLKGKESLWYSFSVLYGSGTIGAYAAYAFSPFNLLYLADFLSLPLATTLICALKLGLAAVTFQLFATRGLKTEAGKALFFSVSYALSSCLLVFASRPMWLDACYMLPLLILLVRRLVLDGRFILLTLALSYTALCCYSVAVPVFVFTFTVLLTMLIVRPLGKKSVREHLSYALGRLGRFLLAFVLILLLGAFLLIPLYYVLRDHALPQAGFPGISASIGDILSALYFYEAPGFSAAVPYLYCGLPALLLLPFYFIDRERPIRQKIAVSVLFVFLVSAMLLGTLWKLMDPFTDGTVSYRFSFCLVFLLCAIGAETIDSFVPTTRTLLLTLSTIIIFYGLMLPVRELTGLTTDNARMLSRNTFLLLLWCALLLLRKAVRNRLPVILAFGLLFVELFVNGQHLIGSFPSAYPLSVDPSMHRIIAQKGVETAAALHQDETLYRIRLDGSARVNDGVALALPTLCSSAPYDNADLRQNLHYLGVAQDSGRIYDYSLQEINDLLFGVKYTADLTAGTLTRTRAFLPIAYGVSPALEDYAPTYNPFANQAMIIEEMTGKTYTFFTPIDPETIESQSFNLDYIAGEDTSYLIAYNPSVLLSRLTFSVPKNGHQALLADFYQDSPSLFAASPFILSQSCPLLYFTPSLSDGTVIRGSEKDPAGFYADPDRFYLTFGSGDPPVSGSHSKSYLTYFDDTELEALAADLSSAALTLTSCSGSSLSGTVTIPEDRTLLFTSIPLDDGWSAWVDDTPVSVYPILNKSFCALKLTPGTHTVSMQYTAPGSITGGLISTVSVLVLAGVAAILFLRRGKRSEDAAASPAEENASETGGNADA